MTEHQIIRAIERETASLQAAIDGTTFVSQYPRDIVNALTDLSDAVARLRAQIDAQNRIPKHRRR